MPQKNTMPLVNALITLIIGAIIIGAVGLSVMATFENTRFLQMNGQIFDSFDLARRTASQQKNFALTAGEDMWGSLAHLGVLSAATPPINPWQQPLNATIQSSGVIRLETTLPAVACRRIVLNLVENAAAMHGFVGAEAHSATVNIWTQVYPLSSLRVQGINIIEFACGGTGMAHVALAFQVR